MQKQIKTEISICVMFYKYIHACVYFDIIFDVFNGTLMYLWSSTEWRIHSNPDYI